MKFSELLEDRILVVPDEPENMTKGGIMLPDGVRERPRKGTVLQVGPGKRCEFNPTLRHSMTVKKGDRVLFTIYSGADVEIDGYKDKLRLMEEKEVIGILEAGANSGSIDSPEYHKRNKDL